jgi:hypothetical protein
MSINGKKENNMIALGPKMKRCKPKRGVSIIILLEYLSFISTSPGFLF